MPAPLQVAQVEIRVRNLDAAVALYRGVFGWAVPYASGGLVYLDTGQSPLLCLIVDERMPVGVGNNCVVESVAEVTARCRALGGRVVIEGNGGGPYAGTLDPWNNELFFWQPTVPRPPHRSPPRHPIIALEIATPAYEAAQRYYEGLCGWSFWEQVGGRRGSGSADGCGFPGGVVLTQAVTNGIRNYIGVESLEDIRDRLAAQDVFMSTPQDFPLGGRFAVFADRDGNRLGLYEPPRRVH